MPRRCADKATVKLLDHPQATASISLVERAAWMCGPADPVPDGSESRPLSLRVLLHKALEAVLFGIAAEFGSLAEAPTQFERS